MMTIDAHTKRCYPIDLRLPTLAFGTAHIQDDSKAAIHAIQQAIDLGMNYFDTAPYYGHGHCEQVLGQALNGIKREKFVVSTKIGRERKYVFRYHKQAIIHSIDNSLKKLNVDNIDIVFCHDIEFVDKKIIIEEALPTLIALKQAGKLNYIGVSGYPLDYITQFATIADVNIIMSYAHYCLYNNRLANYFSQLSQQQTGIINASPFAMGLLNRGAAPSWHPADKKVIQYCQSLYQQLIEEGIYLEHVCIQHSIRCQQLLSTLIGIINEKQLQQIHRWANTPLPDSLINDVINRFAIIKDYRWQQGKPENNDL